MNGDVVKLLAACALALVALGAVVGITVARQVRRFTRQLQEEERAAAEERQAASEEDDNNGSGASV